MPLTAAYSEKQRIQDLRACRRLLAGGSRSFYAASFLLPPRVRAPATALYAFCRIADDAIDTNEGGDSALENLRERLDAAYRGLPQNTAPDRALAEVVARFAIPRALPEALIDGFAWDKTGRTYETIEDLLDYAARVAGTVGAMMALLMGRRESDVVARACDLGMAMQLTNVARDVGEDARNGRLYLPRDWMRAQGLNPDAWLAAPEFSSDLAAVIRRVLAVADDLYTRADAGIGRLPADCRPGITAARLLYAEIGREVERLGGDSVSARAVVPGSRKLGLLLGVMNTMSRRVPWRDENVVPAARFLVDAAAVDTGLPSGVQPIAWWDVQGRVRFVIDLFERLERRQLALRETSGLPRGAPQTATA